MGETEREIAGRPLGWQWTHEHDAELIRRDGYMCEQHPGIKFPHDDCAGPGQAWVIEGKDAITAALTTARQQQREVDDDPENMACPFCSDVGFDLPGLKAHLLNDCKVFDSTERLFRW